jgi:Ca2+-binding RTX toxin-like protein
MTTNIGGKAVQSYAESATDLAGNVGWSPGVALLYQQSSNQTLVGGSGNDVLIANHLDTLTGGAGSDTFVFNPGFGKSNITDFDVGQDILRIDHNLFTSVSGVFSHSKDSGAGMVISFNAANTITLVGVHAADLQAHQDHVQLF